MEINTEGKRGRERLTNRRTNRIDNGRNMAGETKSWYMTRRTLFRRTVLFFDACPTVLNNSIKYIMLYSFI